jgi:excisionase family DNA binding protein
VSEPDKGGEELLTIQEAAEIKGAHPNSIWLAVKEGRLPAIRRGKKMWFIRRADLDAWEKVGHRPRKKSAE